MKATNAVVTIISINSLNLLNYFCQLQLSPLLKKELRIAVLVATMLMPNSAERQQIRS